MAKGFFRELKHYKLYEISKEFDITIEETKRLVGILKKYGIVKAVRASKPEYEELSNQDLVLTDVSETNTDVEYVFDFVGVVMLEEYVFKCYPKYITSTTEPVRQLKQVLKVIKKYNDKEQSFNLYNGEAGGSGFNRLASSLYLLEDYFQYGLYTNRQEVVETNGEGEILWDRTIDETAALLQNSRPYYVELKTRNTVDNDMDDIRRLHECVLSQCTREWKECGLLELFDIAGAELTDAKLSDFGDVDYIGYRLEKEIRTQFVTRKQTLLKTLYTYIFHENTRRGDVGLSLYGTNSFQLVWERVCAWDFGNMLDRKLSFLPRGVSAKYAAWKERTLKSIIPRPVWHQKTPAVSDGDVDTLRPDMICIYPCGEPGEYCFAICDAKYYCIEFIQRKDGYKVTGQPGVGDVIKQYMYQLAYDDFIVSQGYQYVQNIFLCPQEEAEPDYGYVEMKMLHTLGDRGLANIAVVKLCAEEMYELYLNHSPIQPEPAALQNLKNLSNRIVICR